MIRFSRTARNSLLALAAILASAVSAFAGTVTISSPSNGAYVSSSFHLVASASSSYSISGMSVYLDGNKVKSTTYSKVDTYISAGSGSHKVTVQAYDKTGSFNKTIYVNVTSSTSDSTSSTSSGTAYTNIDQMTGWNSCTKCAGKDGSGPTATYSMTHVSSPSKDGKAAQFSIGGSSSYANALWWKQLKAQGSAHHFVYDLYFYLKSPNYAQALEFDVNQAVNGKKYIFGTECNIKGSGTWRVWSASTSWQSTGIPCGRPSAYTWHHLTWEFQRTSDGHVKFISVTLDGKKSYVNRAYSPKSSSVSELNVAVQLDGDKNMDDYKMWTDKMKLTYW